MMSVANKYIENKRNGEMGKEIIAKNVIIISAFELPNV